MSLYIGNLHPECTEATLYQKFVSLGKILNIHICRDVDTGQSLGYGYVNFERKPDAEKALSLMNYDLVKGRAIRLMWTKRSDSSNVSANLFVKNLDMNIDEKTLYDIFANYGSILSLKVATDDSGDSRGFGFVQFETEASANEAIDNLNGKLLRGRKMYVSKFIPREKKNGEFRNIYIKNFQSTMKDEDLKELCKKFGTILSSKVMPDENGESRGFGFVCFEDADSAKKAVQDLNGLYLGGRKIYAGRAKKKSERRAEILENLRRKIQLGPP
ncbi:polyadenylate-binding protein 1 [Trichonephila clavata]|uniref:Polyadenylate-binding protein 1 n=1 Tax=Trichonephila clavata TaxID=2740835 RepID=A0A8X6GQN8_TRICU|nr:polyadenylate-binding protein 1 [Trichonephila clavata]